MPLKSKYNQLFEYRDGHLYWKQARGRVTVGTRAGTINSVGYYITTVDGKKCLNHRIIYTMHHGVVPEYIDHINRNKLDNRIENLRSCTQSENMYNQTLAKHNTSGARNVSWSKLHNKWVVHIAVNKRQTHLGLYDDFELAELVAIEARNKYYGAFSGVTPCR